MSRLWTSSPLDIVGLASQALRREIEMSDLVVIVHPNEQKAEEVRNRLFELQGEYLIKIGDAVVAEKTSSGAINLHQMMNITATGAASGSLWGASYWLVVYQPSAWRRCRRGGGRDRGALTDVGINDAFMKKLAESIEPGSAALFVLVQEMTTDRC